ncbi:hypothetical protein J6590_099031 [Homalodisca vitripennis]|nr:hypothetical protein J6590_099031 [Homalodisca vitripennis]
MVIRPHNVGCLSRKKGPPKAKNEEPVYSNGSSSVRREPLSEVNTGRPTTTLEVFVTTFNQLELELAELLLTTRSF